MPEPGGAAPLPTATISAKRRRIPLIWVIPALALAIGAWLAWDTLSKQGPTITISFRAAQGLKDGESTLKYKDITVGTVRTLDFTADHARIVVTVATTSAMRGLLTDSSRFWIVRPEVFAGSLRGIGTLISGPYIAMEPGSARTQDKRDFKGLDDPPVLDADTAGTTFLVKADRLGSLSVGSPVFFRDMAVGQLLGWELGNMAEYAMLHVFVRQPFDAYVNESSRFWNASGLKVNIGGGGIEVQVESLKALLLGGIGFETPDAKAPRLGETAAEFPLYASREAADAAGYRRKIHCIAYFAGSVRGVSPGNDVILHGLKVGYITGVSLQYDKARDAITAPVTFDLEPERVVGVGKQVARSEAAGMDVLLQHGLRAGLQSASLITGQMLISLDFDGATHAGDAQMQDGMFVIPSAPGGGLGNLESSVGALLAKVNDIPFADIGANLNRTLEGTAGIANGPALRQALEAAGGALASTRDVLRSFNANGAPAFRHFPELAANMQATMLNLNRLLLSLNTGYGDNTKFSRDLGRLMVELNDAVRAVRTLADLLTRHPEALLRGRDNKGTE